MVNHHQDGELTGQLATIKFSKDWECSHTVDFFLKTSWQLSGTKNSVNHSIITGVYAAAKAAVAKGHTASKGHRTECEPTALRCVGSTRQDPTHHFQQQVQQCAPCADAIVPTNIG